MLHEDQHQWLFATWKHRSVSNSLNLIQMDNDVNQFVVRPVTKYEQFGYIRLVRILYTRFTREPQIHLLFTVSPRKEINEIDSVAWVLPMSVCVSGIWNRASRVRPPVAAVMVE